MKAAPKLVAGVILCAGFVHMISPKNISIKVVKEDPSMTFDYVVDEGTKDSGIQEFKENEKNIKFDDKSTFKQLRIMIPSRPHQVLDLLNAEEQKRQKYDLIRISAYGVPYYSTRESFNTFKNSQPKSKR